MLAFSPPPPPTMNHPLAHNATWQPCTGNHSVRHHLDSRLFPVSFRSLIPQWKARGSPSLRTLRAPWAMASEYDAALDTLTGITEAQEEMVVDAIAAGGPSSSPFSAFQNHLHIYCSVYAELTPSSEPATVYAQLQHSLLQSFDYERTACLSRGAHKCIGAALWGNVYAMPMAQIKRQLAGEPQRFEVAQRQANYMAHLRASWSQPEPTAAAARQQTGFKGRAASVACLTDAIPKPSPSSPTWRHAVYKPLSIDVASVLRLASLAPSVEDDSDDDDDVAAEHFDAASHRHSINTQMGSCWSKSSAGSRHATTTDDSDGEHEARDEDVVGDQTVRLTVSNPLAIVRSELVSELAQFSFVQPPSKGGAEMHAVGIAM